MEHKARNKEHCGVLQPPGPQGTETHLAAKARGTDTPQYRSLCICSGRHPVNSGSDNSPFIISAPANLPGIMLRCLSVCLTLNSDLEYGAYAVRVSIPQGLDLLYRSSIKGNIVKINHKGPYTSIVYTRSMCASSMTLYCDISFRTK
jgi:hypothetical protein